MKVTIIRNLSFNLSDIKVHQIVTFVEDLFDTNYYFRLQFPSNLKCPFYDFRYCGTCTLLGFSDECCLYECHVLNYHCDCTNCFFKTECPYFSDTFREQYISLLDKCLSTSYIFNNVAKDLPSSYVPEVKVSGKNKASISIINDLGLPIIAISLQEFINPLSTRKVSKKLAVAMKKGLHDFLKYDGEIILTLDVRDELCNDILRRPNFYIDIFNKLVPEYVTTFDAYTYLNIPSAISTLKMLQVYVANSFLVNFDGRVIGLQLGATPFQLYLFTKALLKQNLKIIAVPAYELRRQKLDKIIQYRLDLIRSLGGKTFALSCGPGIAKNRSIYANFYSTFSWYSFTMNPQKRVEKLHKMINVARDNSLQERFVGKYNVDCINNGRIYHSLDFLSYLKFIRSLMG